MDKERINKLVKNPRFIAGIFNYCDRWCERCAFTSRCMNYALTKDEFTDPNPYEINNKAFWNKLGKILSTTLEMVKEKAQEMGIDIDAIDFEEAAKVNERIDEKAKEQPYSLAAMEYIQTVNNWFKMNEKSIKTKSEELVSLTQAHIPFTSPYKDAININDCFEVISWYKNQIYVKLCRAASSKMCSISQNLENFQEDADGSAKVSIIGIERSIAAWATLLQYMPDIEQSILDLLIILKRLLFLVEASFPNARAFIRPGFDTSD